MYKYNFAYVLRVGTLFNSRVLSTATFLFNGLCISMLWFVCLFILCFVYGWCKWSVGGWWWWWWVWVEFRRNAID